MSLQNLEPTQIGAKLFLKWVCLTEDFHNIFVEVAQDSEFTKQTRIFILPRCNYVELDVGGGFWYVRAGAPRGDRAFGNIEWTGIQGPILVVSPKQLPPLTLPLLQITKTQAMTNGFRVHVKGYDEKCLALYEITESTFHSSKRKMYYTFDGAMNHFFDIQSLDPLKTYKVRLWGFESWPTESIDTVGEWIVLDNVKAISPNRAATKRVTQTDVTQFSFYTGQAQDEKTTVLRFTSQKEYALWLSQKTKHVR